MRHSVGIIPWLVLIRAYIPHDIRGHIFVDILEDSVTVAKFVEVGCPLNDGKFHSPFE